jgi:hypothetical protein
MRATRLWVSTGLNMIALLFLTGTAFADDISGLISTTRTIRDNSRLVGDVTCTVTGAPCIMFGASHIELRLNGFTVTGQADPTTACNGAATAGEHGISSGGQSDVEVRGPGVIQRFRATGVFFTGTLLGKVEGVTATTNCQSGILINATSSKISIGSNVAVRNGSPQPGTACGGI